MDDAEAALSRLQDTAPSVPVFVLGESMGGLIALLLALRKHVGPQICGLVLCGAALKMTEALQPPRTMIALAKLIGLLFPELAVPGESLFGDTWDEAFGDDEARTLSKIDPLVNFGIPMTMGGLRAHFRATDGIGERAADLEVGNLLAMHYVADTRVSFEAVQSFVRNAAKVESRETVPFGGNSHQLFQDVPDVRSNAISRVIQFVQEHSGKRAEEPASV